MDSDLQQALGQLENVGKSGEEAASGAAAAAVAKSGESEPQAPTPIQVDPENKAMDMSYVERIAAPMGAKALENKIALITSDIMALNASHSAMAKNVVEFPALAENVEKQRASLNSLRLELVIYQKHLADRRSLMEATQGQKSVLDEKKLK